MTFFTGLADEFDTDVLETVLPDHSLPEFFRTFLDPACNFGINRAPGKHRLSDGVHVINRGGNCVRAHTGIVGLFRAAVNGNHGRR